MKACYKKQKVSAAFKSWISKITKD